tara:strand:+ start:412 stop:651 length:240 start_codon:yes stop_codon:yes gene_type:complete
MNEEWFDELTNGEPLLCSSIQMGVIESLLRISPISESKKSEILSELNIYSEDEASSIIRTLKEDVVETDVRKQWKKMFN